MIGDTSTKRIFRKLHIWPFDIKYTVKASNFNRSYLSKFLSDFQKLGPILIKKKSFWNEYKVGSLDILF